MFGFFRRKPKTPPPAPIDDQRDSEDWQPGDLLRVTHVIEAVANFGFEVRMTALTFESKPADTGWQSTAFRKIRPEIKAAEDEFSMDLLQRIGTREPA